jgi:hypothetical protein
MDTPTAQRDPGAVSAPPAAHNGAPAARSGSRTFSTLELAFVIGVPLAWAILLLFHPRGEDGFYEGISGNVVPWVTVHLGMGVFVPQFAGAVYLLLRGLDSTAATVSRIGLAVFAIFYAAWELVLGVGTGLFTEEISALPQAQQAVGADLVDPLIAIHEPPPGPIGLVLFVAAVVLIVRSRAPAAAPSAPAADQPVPA